MQAPGFKLARRVVRKLRRGVQFCRLSILRLKGVDVDATVQVFGRLHIQRTEGSSIRISEGVVMNSLMQRNTLEARGPNVLKTLTDGASIELGQDSGITSSTISAAYRISVGQRVLIGAGTLITDSDHHIVAPSDVSERRHSPFPTAQERHKVLIEDDVFIGARTIVLKGVTIGRGSVIGAGSVVSGDIPAGVIAAGNPCRIIQALTPKER